MTSSVARASGLAGYTAVVKGSSTSDVLLLLQTELMMVTEVEDGG
jgi:hypothetical protein